jgi:hypothetical protein
MAQLALYVDDDLVHKVDEAAAQTGQSRSAWVRAAIQLHLRNRLPQDFFQRLGTWRDERTPDQILADVRTDGVDTPREAL